MNATKRKSNAARVGVLALALALVSACLLGGTLAKYSTEVTGTGSATVAKWSFTANGATDKFDVSLVDETQTGVAEGRIAPGAKGSFAIELDANGSEVAVDYTIAFSNLTGMPDGLKFYSDSDRKNAIDDLGAYEGLNGTIALANVGTSVTKTVYWAWAEGADAEDTVVGKDPKAGTFAVTVTGTQKTDAAAA